VDAALGLLGLVGCAPEQLLTTRMCAHTPKCQQVPACLCGFIAVDLESPLWVHCCGIISLNTNRDVGATSGNQLWVLLLAACCTRDAEASLMSCFAPHLTATCLGTALCTLLLQSQPQCRPWHCSGSPLSKGGRRHAQLPAKNTLSSSGSSSGGNGTAAAAAAGGAPPAAS
jgi:hypothetical protein